MIHLETHDQYQITLQLTICLQTYTGWPLSRPHEIPRLFQ